VSFRVRLFLAFLAAVLLPLALLAAGVRREMTRRLTAEYQRRVSALTGVLRDDLAADDAALAARVRGIASALAADTRFRLAADGLAERRWLLDYGADAMGVAGLAVLQVQDSSGRVLTSGHFRNEYDRIAPDLARLLARLPPGPALARVRTAEGAVLALVHADSFDVGSQRYTIVGGSAIEPATIGRLARDPDLRVSLLLPGDTLGAAPALRDSDARPAGALSNRTERVAADHAIPYVDARRDSATIASAQLVVSQRLGTLAALRRSVDLWFLGGLGATLLLALVLAAVLANRVSRPLGELAAKTAAIDLDRLDQDFSSDRDDEIGGLSRLLGAMVDRLRTGTARLRDAERRAATGDLARQVNHDVKNGLIPIRHVLRHLADIAEREPERMAVVFAERRGTLDSSVAYLERLARSYAQLSPAGGVGAADVNAVVREVVAGIAPGTAELCVDLADALPAVPGDATVVRRIVENLVTNAIESLASRAGRVTVSTRAQSSDGGGVCLSVTDTGRGMTRAELAGAFEDFYTTKDGGTGLGLSVVRRLVTDLGGRLRVETQPGTGSSFLVELPPAPAASSVSDGARA
jgi:signal transduction histidine kinase